MAIESTLLLGSQNNIHPKQKCIGFAVEFRQESKRLWKLAGPAIITRLCEYSLGALTQTFTGLVNDVDLAAVAVENSVIAGLGYGVMLGMVSALTTLCGQAYGAGELKMLGVYLQRSWVILLTTACLLVPIYFWSSSVLKLFGQTTQIAEAAELEGNESHNGNEHNPTEEKHKENTKILRGNLSSEDTRQYNFITCLRILATGRFALWMLPQLFACAINFPIQRFLQAQGKVMVMAWISAVVLVLHVLFSWLLILKLGWGLTGAAITLNTSWWLLVIGQLLYIFIRKSDGAWTGLSWLAFSDLWGFVKLSLSSAVMSCLEFWYLMIVVVITGLLPSPLIAVDAISICMNINGWDAMIAIGFNAAISVRVSNELGAGNAWLAKFSILEVSITSMAIGVICMAVVYATRDSFPHLFTNSEAVAQETTKLGILLGITVLLNSLQPVLSGVAVGAGWQALVAYINIGCYYIIGLPVCVLLGFKFGFGVEGIWSGIIGGICLQTMILITVTVMTSWDKEAEQAGCRIKRWGGSIADPLI